MGARQVIERLYEYYAAGQVKEAFAACGKDFRFHWIAEPDLVKHTAAGVDLAGFLERIGVLRELYEYKNFKPTRIVAEGDQVAAQVVIDMVHKASGRPFKMPCAHFWTVHGEEVVEFTEYYDTALAASVEGRPEAEPSAA